MVRVVMLCAWLGGIDGCELTHVIAAAAVVVMVLVVVEWLNPPGMCCLLFFLEVLCAVSMVKVWPLSTAEIRVVRLGPLSASSSCASSSISVASNTSERMCV